MEERFISAFFECLGQLDPLDAGFPPGIQQARKRWSDADSRHLPQLLTYLRESFDGSDAQPRSYETVTAEIARDEVRFLCLEAICAIDRIPESIPPEIRDCLRDRDYSIRAKALGYVKRAKQVDAASRACVKRVARDGKASIGNRLLALWVLWILRRGNRGVET